MILVTADHSDVIHLCVCVCAHAYMCLCVHIERDWFKLCLFKFIFSCMIGLYLMGCFFGSLENPSMFTDK